tara:strand:+ start:3381 stop:3623 length:243 start_codon:yes stop_codon:yes gene_type:complete
MPTEFARRPTIGLPPDHIQKICSPAGALEASPQVVVPLDRATMAAAPAGGCHPAAEERLGVECPAVEVGDLPVGHEVPSD